MLGGSACGCFPVGVANTTEYPFSSKQLNGPTSSSPQYPNSDRTTKIRLAISTPRVPRRVRRPCDLTRTTGRYRHDDNKIMGRYPLAVNSPNRSPEQGREWTSGLRQVGSTFVEVN